MAINFKVMSYQTIFSCFVVLLTLYTMAGNKNADSMAVSG